MNRRNSKALAHPSPLPLSYGSQIATPRAHAHGATSEESQASGRPPRPLFTWRLSHPLHRPDTHTAHSCEFNHDTVPRQQYLTVTPRALRTQSEVRTWCCARGCAASNGPLLFFKAGRRTPSSGQGRFQSLFWPCCGRRRSCPPPKSSCAQAPPPPGIGKYSSMGSGSGSQVAIWSECLSIHSTKYQ